MIKVGSIFIVAVLALIIQGCLHHCGVPDWLLPQGLVACVVFLSFFECNVSGALGAFGLGLLLDLTSATVLGPWAGSYVAVYAILIVASQRLFVESIVVGMVTTALAVFMTGSMYLALSSEFQVLSLEDVGTLVGQAGASACVAPLVMKVLHRAWSRHKVVSMRRGSMASAM